MEAINARINPARGSGLEMPDEAEENISPETRYRVSKTRHNRILIGKWLSDNPDDPALQVLYFYKGS